MAAVVRLDYCFDGPPEGLSVDVKVMTTWRRMGQYIDVHPWAEYSFFRTFSPQSLKHIAVIPRSVDIGSRTQGETCLAVEVLYGARRCWSLRDCECVALAMGRLGATLGNAASVGSQMTHKLLNVDTEPTATGIDALVVYANEKWTREEAGGLQALATSRSGALNVLLGSRAVVSNNNVSEFTTSVCYDRGDARVTFGDWTRVGLLAVGADLASIVSPVIMFGETDLSDLRLIEEAVIDRYREGLRDAGLDVDTAMLWRGYAAAATLRLLRRARVIADVERARALGEPGARNSIGTKGRLARRFRAMLPHHCALAQRWL